MTTKQAQITHYQACIAETLERIARWEARERATDSPIDTHTARETIAFLASELRDYRAKLATIIAFALALGLLPGHASARQAVWNSTPPVDCQAQAMWEDGSGVCQFGSAMWSFDPDTEAWTRIARPTVYLRALVPAHGR